MGGWKRIGTLPPTFNFEASARIGCYGNSLIDVEEKPKILKRFWQRRSRVIRNSCKREAIDIVSLSQNFYMSWHEIITPDFKTKLKRDKNDL